MPPNALYSIPLGPSNWGHVFARALSERIGGSCVVDLASGAAVKWMRFDHTITELYDVAMLPESRPAEAVGFVADDIRREVSVEPA